MANKNRLAKRYLEALAADPELLEEEGFETLLRYLDANSPLHERIGYSVSLKQDAFRLGQTPLLHFHASAFSEVCAQPQSGQYKLKNVYWGLFGINGPLPHHLTEHAISRQYHNKDKTLAEFCDIFHHRYLSFFYRAWAESRPAVCHDHARQQRDDKGPQSKTDSFARKISSISGVADARAMGNEDNFERFIAGLLSQKNRGVGMLEQALTVLLDKPVKLITFEGKWYDIAEPDCSRLGVNNVRLGQEAMLGSRCFQRSFDFTINIGPLTYEEYLALIEDPYPFRRIRDVTNRIVGREYSYSIQLILKPRQKRAAQLGAAALGMNSWAGTDKCDHTDTHVAYRQQI